jgi:nucleotide-binding universal stress UspA family protein
MIERTATVPQRGPDPVPRVDDVLLVVGSNVPYWLRRWGEHPPRELRYHPEVPGCRPGEPAGAVERVTAIADLAAGAARSGGAVLVLPDAAPPRTGRPRVVAAVRRLPDDAQALADAAAIAEHMGADLVVAHALPTSFGERSTGLEAAVDAACRLLDAAAEAACRVAPGLPVQPWLARVHPHELVGEEMGADLLVMGGPRVDLPGALGLVARSALFHARCPVLLAPRPARPAPTRTREGQPGAVQEPLGRPRRDPGGRPR